MFRNNLQKLNTFLVYIFVFGFSTQTIFAENYVDNNLSAGAAANKLCEAYNARPSTPGAAVGGGSAVPVSAVNIGPAIFDIDSKINQVVDELKIAHSTQFCAETNYQAQSIAAIKAIAKKELDARTASCQGNLPCLQERARKGTTQRIIDELSNDTNNPNARDIAKALVTIENPDVEAAKVNKIYKMSQECQKDLEKYKYRTAKCDLAIANGAYPSEIIRQGLQAAELRIGTEQGQLQKESDQSLGLTATRVCLKTKSGKAPPGVQFYDPDCLSYKVMPLFMTQESVRQIVALPYNQAFSAAGILGPDGGLANISTRVREGNLFDKDTTQNFGSQSGQTQGSPTGGGGTVLGNLDTGGTAQELTGTEANYKKLIANVDVVLNLYSAAKLAYSSSTSVCAQVPIVSKAATIDKIVAAQKPFSDYKTIIKASWEDAIKNPTKNHVSLINTINTDLRDKINQTLINSVLEAVKKLLQICTTSVPTS